MINTTIADTSENKDLTVSLSSSSTINTSSNTEISEGKKEEIKSNTTETIVRVSRFSSLITKARANAKEFFTRYTTEVVLSETMVVILGSMITSAVNMFVTHNLNASSQIAFIPPALVYPIEFLQHLMTGKTIYKQLYELAEKAVSSIRRPRLSNNDNQNNEEARFSLTSSNTNIGNYKNISARLNSFHPSFGTDLEASDDNKNSDIEERLITQFALLTVRGEDGIDLVVSDESYEDSQENSQENSQEKMPLFN